MKAGDGQVRVVISGVQPELDGGRFPIKRTVGEKVIVEADIFVDGHEALSAVLLYRHEEETQWNQIALQPLVNDRWHGAFVVTRVGRYRYTVQAWADRFTSWRRDLAKRIEAGQDIAIDLGLHPGNHYSDPAVSSFHVNVSSALSSSFFKNTTARGGSVRFREWKCPW